jgi:hypothetical protein
MHAMSSLNANMDVVVSRNYHSHWHIASYYFALDASVSAKPVAAGTLFLHELSVGSFKKDPQDKPLGVGSLSR